VTGQTFSKRINRKKGLSAPVHLTIAVWCFEGALLHPDVVENAPVLVRLRFLTSSIKQQSAGPQTRRFIQTRSSSDAGEKIVQHPSEGGDYMVGSGTSSTPKRAIC
jgi:hypothetical protein